MREIRFHDTLAGTVRALDPREPGEVGIYVCGPTVYARVHVGNARPFVVFALLKRFLEAEGHRVTLVENVTDVNDKIYDAARAAGVSSAELAREMTGHYLADTDRLRLGRPDHEPLASQTIAPIVDLIEALIDRDHAYAAGGDVYFRVRSHPGYGRLSNRPADEMDQGEEDDAAPGGLKESPRDFALWKARKPGEDTSWPAPWGEGRPGWHIECSAMAEAILGLDFDIHGGGSDLVFPHHENEIAQTEAGRGVPLARLWLHNGMVRFGAQGKMSKSVGNIRSLAGALDEAGRDALVMFFVSAHYRKPLEFSAELLAEAGRKVERVANFCRRLDPDGPDPPGLEELRERFLAALADDFATPAALSELFAWVAAGNRHLDAGDRMGPGRLGEILRLIGMEHLLGSGPTADSEVERLLAAREEARAARDFAASDAARDELAALGWSVRDTPEGPRLVPRS